MLLIRIERLAHLTSCRCNHTPAVPVSSLHIHRIGRGRGSDAVSRGGVCGKCVRDGPHGKVAAAACAAAANRSTHVPKVVPKDGQSHAGDTGQARLVRYHAQHLAMIQTGMRAWAATLVTSLRTAPPSACLQQASRSPHPQPASQATSCPLVPSRSLERTCRNAGRSQGHCHRVRAQRICLKSRRQRQLLLLNAGVGRTSWRRRGQGRERWICR